MLSVCHKHMSWCHRAVDARLSSLLVLPVTCSSRQRAGCFSKVSIFKCLPCGGKLMTQAQMFLQTWKACESKDFFCFFFPFLRNYLPFEKQKFLWAVQLQHLKNQPYAAPGGLDSFLVVSSVGHQPDCIFYSLLFTSYIFRFLLTLIKFSFSKTGQFCSCGFSPYARVTNKKKNSFFMYQLYIQISDTCISFKWLWYGTTHPCAEMSLLNSSNSNSTSFKKLKYISAQIFSLIHFEPLLSGRMPVSQSTG